MNIKARFTPSSSLIRVLSAAGMNMSPQDHIDPAAFQPSHTLSFEMGPGATINFFEDASMGDVGKVRWRVYILLIIVMVVDYVMGEI